MLPQPRFWLSFWLSALALSLAANLCLADPDPNKMRFQHLLTSDGDSDQQGIGAIKDIVQDPEGFMWFAGEFGLARYDSHQFKFFYYDNKDPNSLSANYVTALELDKTGTLWVGTGNGLNRYNRETENFERYLETRSTGKPSISSNAVFSLATDANNQLYIGTAKGLNILSASRTYISRYTYTPSTANSLSSNNVRTLLIDSHQKVWLGTAGGGLNLFDPVSKKFQHWNHTASSDSIPADDVEHILEDHTGQIWIATSNNGLGRLNADQKTFKVYQHDQDNPRSLGSNDIRRLFEDSHNTVWVSTDHGGLARYNPATDDFDTLRHNPFDPSSLRSNQLRNVYEDRDGNLWIGTFPDGINFYDVNKSRFNLYVQQPSNANSLPSNGILSLLQDSQGTIWIGTEGGLSALNPTTGLIKTYKANPKDPNSLRFIAVSSVAQDPSGDLWVGTWSGGLHRFNRQTEQFKSYLPDTSQPNAIASPYVWQIKRDQQQNIWISFVDRGGFARYVPATDSFESYIHDPTNENSLTSDHVVALTPDTHGNLWLGTLSGLDKFNIATKKFTHFQHKPNDDNSIGSNHILAVFEDHNGNIWVGTQGAGVSVLDAKTQQFKQIRMQDGLPSNAVSSIIEDNQGMLWLGTLNGVASYDPTNQRMHIYRKSDGFAGSSVNRNTTLLDNRGHLWIGSTGGITEFNPQDLNHPHAAPAVMLTGLRIANKPQIPAAQGSRLEYSLSHTKELTLSYRDVMFTIEYTALSFNSSERNQYAYKLDGFDAQWNEVGKERIATYTNLNPGNYTFHVKAANSDGVWNEQGASIEITISPPVWHSDWAFIAYAIILAMFIYFRRQYVKLKHKTAEYQVLSTTDPLTGIYNRSGLQQIISGLFINEEMKKGVCLMIFDIDHFKHINDRLGHAAGDRILQELAKVVSATIRSSDHFARWGGEEFVLLCSSTTIESASWLAEKVRAAINNHAFDAEATPLTVTVSIGVAACKPEDDFDSTLKRADLALYRAKNSGRNCVMVEP